MQATLATTEVPVIFLSAYGRKENATRDLGMGPRLRGQALLILGAGARYGLRSYSVPVWASRRSPHPYVRGDLGIDYTERG